MLMAEERVRTLSTKKPEASKWITSSSKQQSTGIAKAKRELIEFFSAEKRSPKLRTKHQEGFPKDLSSRFGLGEVQWELR